MLLFVRFINFKYRFVNLYNIFIKFVNFYVVFFFGQTILLTKKFKFAVDKLGHFIELFKTMTFFIKGSKIRPFCYGAPD